MSWLTLIISSSPSPENPSIGTITSVINEMRRNIPDVPALIMCDAPYDALRFDLQPDFEKQTDPSEERFAKRCERYAEYKLALAEWCNSNNTRMVVFNEHTHRANMTRRVLDMIDTPCVLTLDHDTLVEGVSDWDRIERAMNHPDVNSIRFYTFDQIHPSHAHLVRYPVLNIEGVPLLRTIQYGDCPSVQRTSFLRYTIERYIGLGSKCFIEEIMWPQVHNSGWDGWGEFKLWLYAPENMRCRVHTNIRGNWPTQAPIVERI